VVADLSAGQPPGSGSPYFVLGDTNPESIYDQAIAGGARMRPFRQITSYSMKVAGRRGARMGKVLVANGLETTASLRVGGASHEVRFKDHLGLLRRLLGICDACLLEAPFLYADFAELFAELGLRDKEVELITSAKPKGDDQLKKPYALRSFGMLAREATGKWPVIHLNNNLHSKIYLFFRGGEPFAGVVTSANLTHAGLCTSHETGVLIDDVAQLHALAEIARRGIEFVHLAEHQIERMCWFADAYKKDLAPYAGDIDLGLGNFLNAYAVPAAGNRNILLAPNVRYFIKVSGVTERPILPRDRVPWDTPYGELDFNKSPGKKIEIGACLLEIAVGGQCFLSYHVCASEPYERTEQEKASNADYKRWPFYVFGNNLSLHYGKVWFEAPIMIAATIEEFKREHPDVTVTMAGGDNIIGAMQMGNSYFQVTREFGEFVRRKIDAFALPGTKA
jgi:hypothetical protein